MPLVASIAGAYTVTWNAVSIGVALKEGSEIEIVPKVNALAGSDTYGESTYDLLYRGVDVFYSTTSLEYKAGSTGPSVPFAALGLMGVIGQLGSGVAQALVMTATAGTPAAASPATLTAAAAVLAPGFSPKYLFDSRLREAPIKLQFLPTTISSAVKHFVLT